MTESTATPPAQPPQDPAHPGHHKERNKWVFIGAIVLAVILAIILLVTYTQHKHSAEAASKARQLQAAMVAAGYPEPDEDTLIAIFGRDGGAVCKDPTGALNKAQWLDNMANGAGGPGMRPVIADRKAVAAEAIVISVYCPDHLQAFQDKIDDLKTGTTVRR
ncbi:hypothetical protein [Catenulispora subtropica]|uniref:Uncharacterized protein n=1 Tax=Catenulispora subtropica TaxID=450798 RepID=A0ABN2R6D3_9ACTN